MTYLRSLSLTAGAVLVLSLASSAPADDNLVQNGGFEAPDISLGNYYQTVDAGQSGLTDWTVTGVSIDIVSSVAANDPAGTSGEWSHSGTQGIDLAGTPGPGGVLQSLSTVAGQDYTLSFWASTNGPSQSDLYIQWDGTDLAGTPPASGLTTPAQGLPSTWTEFTYNVVGTGSDTVALFTNNSSNAGPLVDDVSVVAAPEPSALWTLGMGLALSLGLVLRSRFA